MSTEVPSIRLLAEILTQQLPPDLEQRIRQAPLLAKRGPSSSCIFCGGTHFNEHCDRYSTLFQCKQRLRQLGRCFICLHRHTLRDCPPNNNNACDHCKQTGHHNRAICPKRSSDRNAAQSVTVVTTAASENCPSNQETGVETPTLVNTNTTQALACTERVLLQTAVATICLTNGTGSTSARILLDSGSQRTFMTDRFAARLKPEHQREESLCVSMFGANRPQDMKTYVVCSDLILKDGSRMPIEANVLQAITRPIQRDLCRNKTSAS